MLLFEEQNFTFTTFCKNQNWHDDPLIWIQANPFFRLGSIAVEVGDRLRSRISCGTVQIPPFISFFETLSLSKEKCFASPGNQLGRTSLVQHVIDTGDAAPIKQRPYRVSPDFRKEIDRQVDEMLEKGIISEIGVSAVNQVIAWDW